MRTLLILLLALPTLLSAQLIGTADPVRRYGTVNYNPTGQRGTHRSAIRANLPKLGNPEYWEEVSLPVVVHLVGTGLLTGVSDADIVQQLAGLQEDFNGITTAEAIAGGRADREFARLASREGLRVKFCIPEQDPNGLPVRGIVRRVLDLRLLGGDLRLLRSERVGSPAWDPEHYLNVWIAELPDSLSGFAQFPGAAGASDGIVIDRRFFLPKIGAEGPYGRGRTLTHLVANYLGLPPIWGDGTYCSDDGIPDTPLHNGPNFGRPGPAHFSTCAGNPREMTGNFMDNCADEATYFFTRGQVRWMRAALLPGGGRSGLIQSPGSCAPRPKTVAQTDTVVVTGKQTSSAASLIVAPNPATAAVVVTAGKEITGATLEVYDLAGRLTYRHPATVTAGQPVHLRTEDWSRGAYYVRLTTPSGGGGGLTKLILQ